MTVQEWMQIKRYSPADAYAELLYMVRRKEATMHSPPRGLWRDKWQRRIRTRFELPEHLHDPR